MANSSLQALPVGMGKVTVSRGPREVPGPQPELDFGFILWRVVKRTHSTVLATSGREKWGPCCVDTLNGCVRQLQGSTSFL